MIVDKKKLINNKYNLLNTFALSLGAVNVSSDLYKDDSSDLFIQYLSLQISFSVHCSVIDKNRNAKRKEKGAKVPRRQDAKCPEGENKNNVKRTNIKYK